MGTKNKSVVQRLFDEMGKGRCFDVIDDSHLRTTATESGRGAVGPASR